MSYLIIADLPSPSAGKTGWPWTTAADLSLERTIPVENLPRISIVTPSYNQGQFIEETIRSVLFQRYPNLEYYIFDGGSTDQTVEIIKKYEPWLSGWVSERDSGQSDAINKGWRRCSGDWLGWMNSDDTYLPDALWRLALEIIQNPDCGVIAGSAVWIDISGQIIHHQVVSDFNYLEFLQSLKNHLPSGSTLIRRSVVDKIGDLDISMQTICDTDYWLRAGLVAKVHTFQNELSTFRYHPESKTVNLEQIKGIELIRAYDNLYALMDIPPTVLSIKEQAYCFCYLEAAYYANRSGEKQLCWYYLTKSLQVGWRYANFRHFSVAVQNILGLHASNSIRKMLSRINPTQK